jgi:uncharacterized protein YceK
MIKKAAVFCLVLFVGVAIFGCAKVADTTSGSSGSPPAGTTQVKLSASNIVVNGNQLTMSLSALNQANAVLSGMGTGNFGGAIYQTNPTITAAGAKAQATAVVTLTFSAISGGGSGTAKNVNAALVLDKSGSMGWDDGTLTKVTSEEIAAKAFITEEANSSTSNKAAIIFLDNTAWVEQAMTAVTNTSLLFGAIDKAHLTGGSTALYDGMADGVLEATKEAASSTLVRAVVALTDGGENASVTYTTTKEVADLAIAKSIPIFTVGLYGTTAEAISYRKALQDIAIATTGSVDNYFEIITGITALSVNAAEVKARQIRALGAMTDLYQKLAIGLTQSYTLTCTMSTTLSPGTYWMQITLQNYGSFTGQTVTISFVVS